MAATHYITYYLCICNGRLRCQENKFTSSIIALSEELRIDSSKHSLTLEKLHCITSRRVKS